MAVGLILAIAEVFIPGAVFLGFAVGAFCVGLLMLVGIPLGGVPTMLLVFAIISAASWFALRRHLGVRRGQVKIIKDDVNE